MRTPVLLITLLSAVAAADDSSQPPAAPPKEPKIERKLPKSIRWMNVSPDGKWVCAQCAGSPPSLFSTGDARRLEPFRDFPKPADVALDTIFASFEFTADAKFLVVDAQEVPKKTDFETFRRMRDRLSRSLQVVDLTTGAVVRSIEVQRKDDPKVPGMEDTVSRIAADPRGSLVRIDRTHSVEHWDCATGEFVRSTSTETPVWKSTYSPDGTVVGATFLQALGVADASGRELWRHELDRTPYRGKKFDANAAFKIAGFTTDGAVVIAVATWWEIVPSSGGPNSWQRDHAHGKSLTRIDAYAATDGKLLWSRDADDSAFGETVRVGADAYAETRDGKVCFYDVATGKARDTPLADRTYSCGAFAPDGLTFWAGTSDGQILKIKTFPAPAAK